MTSHPASCRSLQLECTRQDFSSGPVPLVPGCSYRHEPKRGESLIVAEVEQLLSLAVGETQQIEQGPPGR